MRGMSRAYGITDSQVRTILVKADIAIRATRDQDRFRYDISFFETIDTEAKAYCLGLLYADGYIDQHAHGIHIQLKAQDADILREMSCLIARGKDLTRPFTAMNDPSYGLALQISSAKIKTDLIRLGCVPAKTFKIRLPDLDPEVMRHFLRGYFDGDGCLHIGRGRSKTSEPRATFKVVSCTPFCEDVASYMKTHHDLYLGVYHPSRNPNVAAYQTGNDETIKHLYRWMYTGATLFMPRKKGLFEAFFKLRCIDPYDMRPEVKNRRRSLTEIEKREREVAFAARETKPHGLPLWEERT